MILTEHSPSRNDAGVLLPFCIRVNTRRSPNSVHSAAGYCRLADLVSHSNLAQETDGFSLRMIFSQYNGYQSSHVVTDRDMGQSRGFGFVTFATHRQAQNALDATDGQELNGRPLHVSLTKV